MRRLITIIKNVLRNNIVWTQEPLNIDWYFQGKEIPDGYIRLVASWANASVCQDCHERIVYFDGQLCTSCQDEQDYIDSIYRRIKPAVTLTGWGNPFMAIIVGNDNDYFIKRLNNIEYIIVYLLSFYINIREYIKEKISFIIDKFTKKNNNILIKRKKI